MKKGKKKAKTKKGNVTQFSSEFLNIFLELQKRVFVQIDF